MLLDRYILRSLAVNYLIALATMMSLYVVLDLFVNMDEFTEDAAPTGVVIAGILSYYGNNLFLYFAQLSGVITLFACMASIARLRRQNEMVAILSSGVSLYRVAAPVIAFGLLTSTLWFVDTELIIPGVAHKLARRHDDALGRKTHGVWFLQDRDNALLSAQKFDPSTRTMKRMLVIYREEGGSAVRVLQAEEARWKADEGYAASGFWELQRGLVQTRPLDHQPSLGPRRGIHEEPVSRYESNLNPEAIQLRQSSQWVQFLSSTQLDRLVDKGELDAARIAHIKHSRFATPIVNLLLLLLGLPFMLGITSGNILSDGARCLAVCGACFLISFAGQNLSMPSPLAALPSWLPIFLFAPVVVVLLDRIKT
ncbi:MAG: LptF/LptG family permease [Phycisphaerae bacterium]|nr:LptF/LptG family permease [Phycisphaerae bacterium]